jgi:hypothetical protein
MPKSKECSSATTRKAPYQISNDSYPFLRPEENAWLQTRLSRTAPAVRAFVRKAKLKMSQAESGLRIAVAHTGGGKRAMLNSFGESGGLIPTAVARGS